VTAEADPGLAAPRSAAEAALAAQLAARAPTAGAEGGAPSVLASVAV
jgi:hypothetical protein